MSSFKKREKVAQREHRERGQLHSRKNLGMLEKHKDYVVRAKAYNKKKAVLKSLHEKARNRNPDEFYYKMIKNPLKSGRHVESHKEEEYTDDQLAMMKTRDLKYVQMKIMSERNKIEQLTGSLHLTKQAGKKNTHIHFVDSDDEEIESDDQLEESGRSRLAGKGRGGFGVPSRSKASTRSANGYRELNQRLNRLQQLKIMSAKMETKKKLLTKEKHIRIPGGDGIPVTYKWFTERKK